jgi:dTDP-4-dehydrorhamnose 3,5-epimerase
MDIRTTKLEGVLIVQPRRFNDARGYFTEVFNQRAFRDVGIETVFVQDNQSCSLKRGTVRGLHFQNPPATQAKLVRVVRGCVYDVVLDLRAGSPTYGEWVAERLSADDGKQIYVPHGFAHGFCTLEDNSEVVYKVDTYYAPAHDDGIIWNDSTLNIPWPVGSDAATLSDKDKKLGTFAEFVPAFQYGQVTCLAV